MPPLKNNRRERFCMELISGCSRIEAARRAGYNACENGQTTFRLMNSREIIDRIAELQRMSISDRVMTVIKRKEKLSEIASSTTAKNIDIIHAIAELNKMEGSYASTKTEACSERAHIKAIEYYSTDNEEVAFMRKVWDRGFKGLKGREIGFRLTLPLHGVPLDARSGRAWI